MAKAKKPGGGEREGVVEKGKWGRRIWLGAKVVRSMSDDNGL